MTKKIVIASVLKPVNDARMYEKIATSISRLEGVKISIVGFKGKESQKLPNIDLYPLFDFPRLSWDRFFAPWKFYKFLIKVKPELIIITTHELLIVTCLYKILFGGKIIYDVQENYFRNIAYTNTYPPVFRNLLAAFVRLKEIITRPFIRHYLIAEKNYEKEFSFTKGKSTIIENKTKRPSLNIPIRKGSNDSIRLLYSGTISEEYGIFEAINLAKSLHSIDSNITLTIIGYCSNLQILNKVNKTIKELSFINLVGGNELVPHEEILKAIQSHDLGLISYRPNKSTMNCTPTKLFEYLAYRLPFLLTPNPAWVSIMQQYDAGLIVDYSHFHPQLILKAIKEKTFYSNIPTEDIYWESEESRLLEIVKASLIS